MQFSKVFTGLIGIAAALTVGVGEYLLHYDALARFSAGEYQFLVGINEKRTSIGHFLGVFGAPLYLLGCYHLYQMLRPANNKLAFTAFLIGSFGFVIGAVWIGSRASVSALMQLGSEPQINGLIALYQYRYESLLHLVRISVLLLSLIYCYLVLSGKSHYPKWMVACNPLFMVLLSFVVYLIAPGIGKHMLPIALNIGFFIFFSLSVCFAFKAR